MVLKHYFYPKIFGYCHLVWEKTNYQEVFSTLKRPNLKLISAAKICKQTTKCILKVKISFENIDNWFEKINDCD